MNDKKQNIVDMLNNIRESIVEHENVDGSFEVDTFTICRLNYVIGLIEGIFYAE